MGRITWTEESERWLREIFEYIHKDDPVAAQSVVMGIYDKAQILEEFPEAGYRYEGSARDVRILLYGHYRIAYLVLENRDVDVLGVFHGGLDIKRYAL